MSGKSRKKARKSLKKRPASAEGMTAQQQRDTIHKDTAMKRRPAKRAKQQKRIRAQTSKSRCAKQGKPTKNKDTEAMSTEAKMAKAQTKITARKAKVKDKTVKAQSKNKTETPNKRTSTKEMRRADRENSGNNRKEHAKSFSEFIMGISIFRKVLIGIIVAIVLACAVIYPVAQPWYVQMREQQREQAVLDAQLARNEQLQEENDKLGTDEGVEDEAREQGLVKKGETAVVVTNADDSESTSSKSSEVDKDNIHAPQTWYYAFFDTVFLATDT